MSTPQETFWPKVPDVPGAPGALMDERQFAGKVRAKYPGEYDSLEDGELTRRILDKYPDYRPVVRLSDSELRPSVKSTINDAADFSDETGPIAGYKPIEFKPFDETDLSFLQRAATGAQQLAGADRSNLIRDTQPSLLGKPFKISVAASPGRRPSEDELTDAMLSGLGPSAVEVNRRYKAETGRNLVTPDIAPEMLETGYDPATKTYNVQFRPKQSVIGVLNAYGSGGRAAAESELKAMYERDAQAAERQSKDLEAARAVMRRLGFNPDELHDRGPLLKGLARAGLSATQLVNNVSGFWRDSHDAATDADYIEQVRASIPREKSAVGRFVEDLAELGGTLPQYLSAGKYGAGLVAYTQNLHRGQEAAVKEGLKLGTAGGVGQGVGAAIENLSPLARQIIARHMAGQTNVALDKLSGSERSIVESYLQGAVLPVGKSPGREPSRFSRQRILAEPGDNAPVFAGTRYGDDSATAERVGDVVDSGLAPVSSNRPVIVRKPSGDMSAVIETSQGRMRVSMRSQERPAARVRTPEEIEGAIGRAQSNMRVRVGNWRPQIEAIDNLVTKGSGAPEQARSDFIELIEMPKSDPRRAQVRGDMGRALKLHDEMTEGMRQYLIGSLRRLGHDVLDTWGITEQGYYRHIFDSDPLNSKADQPIIPSDEFSALEKREGAEGYSRNYRDVMTNYASRLARTRELSQLEDAVGSGLEDLSVRNPARATELRERVDQLRGAPIGRDKSPAERVLDYVNVPRAMESSYDVSALGRQGIILSVLHPVKAAKNFPRSIGALFNGRYADKVLREIHTSPNVPVRRDAGLYLADYHHEGQALSRGEEMFQSSIAQSIPGVRASERAFVVFLDKMRADVFDGYAETHPNATPETLKGIANFINKATGRGELGRWGEKHALALSQLFYSPRLQLSRPQLLATPFRGDKTARVYAAKELVKFIGAGIGFMGLAKAAGLQVGTDPLSSDFGKIKVGNTRISIWGGTETLARYTAQLMVGKSTGLESGVTKSRSRLATAVNFLRSRGAPQVTVPLDTALGKDVTGQPATLGNLAQRAFIPLAWRDVEEAIRDDLASGGSGVKGAAVGALGVAGFGVNTITPKTAEARVADEVERLNAVPETKGMSEVEVRHNAGVNVEARRLFNALDDGTLTEAQREELRHAINSRFYYARVRPGDRRELSAVERVFDERMRGAEAALRDKVAKLRAR